MPSKEAKRLRGKLKVVKPLIENLSIELCRKSQDRLGALAAKSNADKTVFIPIAFKQFSAGMLRPNPQNAERRVILYLHGGAYTAGGIDYARGFGSILCAETGLSVFCAAYRLAPESRFPAAVEDALSAYEYLCENGYSPEQIYLVGESAGGGLCFSLALRLKQLGKKMPQGIVAISPWTDLTCSGASYYGNRHVDPSLNAEALRYYAALYAPFQGEEPLVSPIFGELEGLPRTLIFAGGDELLLDDSMMMAERLCAAGVPCELNVEEGLWHVYVLFGTPEADQALARIRSFLTEKAEE